MVSTSPRVATYNSRGSARRGAKPKSARSPRPALRKRFGRPDYALLLAVVGLLILGLNMVYSASFVVAHNSPEYQSDTYFFYRQLLWVGIGLVGMFVASRIDYHVWARFAMPILAIVVLLLVVLLVSGAGHEANGAQRWLQLGPLPPVQPSEFAKLAVIIYFAAWLGKRPGRATSFTHGVLPFGIVTGTIAGLVLAQPDLGSTAIIVVTSLVLFFLGGAAVKNFAVGLPLLGIALYLTITNAGYRSDRWQAFVDPNADPGGLGWHAIQTNIALGSGGLFGLGLGASRQKFYWLPAAHTDSIFAIVGEELGLFGTLMVIGLFLLVCFRGVRLYSKAPDAFGRLLAAGVTIWITLQALTNIAAVASVIPFTGVPLPFVSAGGSSMLITLVAVGILLNVSKQTSKRRSPEASSGQ